MSFLHSSVKFDVLITKLRSQEAIPQGNKMAEHGPPSEAQARKNYFPEQLFKVSNLQNYAAASALGALSYHTPPVAPRNEAFHEITQPFSLSLVLRTLPILLLTAST